MPPYRLVASIARNGLILAATFGTVTAIKIAVDTSKANKSSASKVKPPVSAQPPTPPRKIWPSAVAVAIGTHNSHQRGRKLIGWYKNGIYQQDIVFRGLLDHSVAVEKHLNEGFYRHVPHTMSAPLRIDFDAEPRMAMCIRALPEVHIDYSRITVDDFKVLVLKKLKQCSTRKYSLAITQYAHGEEPSALGLSQVRITECGRSEDERELAHLGFPTPDTTGQNVWDRHALLVKDLLDACSAENYPDAAAICRGIIVQLTTSTSDPPPGSTPAEFAAYLVGCLAQYTIVVSEEDSDTLAQEYFITRQNFKTHINYMVDGDIAPYDEPYYKPKTWLRKNAPRWIRIPAARYGEFSWESCGFPGPVKDLVWENYDVHGQQHDAPLPLEQVLRHYASSQVRVAQYCIDLVKTGHSKYSESGDTPEGPDYFFSHEFDAALLFEWETRHMKMDGMTYADIQKWIGQNPQESQKYVYNREVGKKFWKANPAQRKYWCDNNMAEFQKVTFADFAANVETYEEDFKLKKIGTKTVKEASAREVAISKDEAAQKARKTWLKPAPIFENCVTERKVRKRRVDSLSVASKDSFSGAGQSEDDDSAAEKLRCPPGLTYNAQQNEQNVAACKDIAATQITKPLDSSFDVRQNIHNQFTYHDKQHQLIQQQHHLADQSRKSKVPNEHFSNLKEISTHRPTDSARPVFPIDPQQILLNQTTLEFMTVDDAPSAFARDQYAHWSTTTTQHRGPPPGLALITPPRTSTPAILAILAQFDDDDDQMTLQVPPAYAVSSQVYTSYQSHAHPFLPGEIAGWGWGVASGLEVVHPRSGRVDGGVVRWLREFNGV